MTFSQKVASGSVEEKKLLVHVVLVCGFFIAIDQISKLYISSYVGEHSVIKVIPGLFNITYINNAGAAWGIFAGKSSMLLIISVAVLCAIIFFLRGLTEGWPERYYSLFLIISGILGNSVDRLWRGQVVDFLDFYVGKWHWPSFNVADSCITVGVTVFILSSLLRPQNSKKYFSKKDATPNCPE